MAERTYSDGICYTNAITHAPSDSEEANCLGFMNTDSSGATAITDYAGNTATIYCIQGVVYPIRVKYIKSTGTTPTTFVIFK